MKQSTIDGIIETFDESYKLNKNDSYLKYKSVDKFVKLSQDYAMSLQADNFEKEIFISYFEDHVRSMYRRDFEKIILESEKNTLVLPEPAKNYIKFSWAAIFGVLGGIGGYALTRSPEVAVVISLVGMGLSQYFAKTGMEEGERLDTIVGTKQYDEQLRKELNKKLLYG